MEKILLAGASGRLGREIASAAQENNILVAPLQRDDLKNLEKIISEQKSKGISKLILIDVSLPEGTETITDSLLKMNNIDLQGYIVGTTGHSSALTAKLKELSLKTPVVASSNFSRGIFFLEELMNARTNSGVSVAQLAKQLGFDMAMWESHHTQKKDAPSGTAKTLAVAAEMSLDRVTSTRVGSVVGEHSIFLSQGSEELRFTHTAHSRRLFADGAVDLSRRIFKQGLKKEFHTMRDALNALLKS